MNTNELREIVLHALTGVAPDADLARLDEGADVREALDLDSMDMLRYATALHDRLHVEIPEADYARVITVRGCVDYLARKLDSARAPQT
jgi:acyl carrier protein